MAFQRCQQPPRLHCVSHGGSAPAPHTRRRNGFWLHSVLTDVQVENGLKTHHPDVVVIELPQRMNGGGTVPWTDLQQISKLCKRLGVKLHCDGARIWEVQPFYDVTFSQIAELFDTVYVSFYKGVGAWNGAMVIGVMLWVWLMR